MTKPIVELQEYNSDWDIQFMREKQRIDRVIGHQILAIEHIGSTSVPGLAAKPIIDIMIGISDLDKGLSFVAPLREIDYEYIPLTEIKDRLFFRKGYWRQGTCHMHLCKYNGNEWRDKLLFRDYLRANPKAAAEYVSLKQQLAAKHKYERSAYTKEKGPFIKEILLKVRSSGD